MKKLKNAVKNKTETTLRMGLKMLDRNYLPHEFLLTTRQETKQRNAFNNNMSTDIKLSRAQISKNNWIWWIFRMKVPVPLAKNILAPLEITAAASVILQNTWFWDNNFNNFKQKSDWHDRNCLSS